MSAIGRRFDRESSSVFSVISPTGGIRPERARYLTLIYNMYFALGCKVFPDEVTVTPLLTNEYKLLLDANLEFAGEFEKIGNMMEAKALAGGALAAQPDACDYFKQHPEKVPALRTVLTLPWAFKALPLDLCVGSLTFAKGVYFPRRRGFSEGVHRCSGGGLSVWQGTGRIKLGLPPSRIRMFMAFAMSR
jgi:hypothetical protein